MKVAIDVNFKGFTYLFVFPLLSLELLMYQIRYIFFNAESVKNSILHDNEKFDNWPQLNKWSTIFCEKATFVCMHIICKQTQEQKHFFLDYTSCTILLTFLSIPLLFHFFTDDFPEKMDSSIIISSRPGLFFLLE